MCWFVLLKGYDFSGNSGRNLWIWNLVANICLSQLKTLLFQDCMIATPEPFVFYIVHHVTIMVFNNKRCWLKNFAKYLHIQGNRLKLCTPNSRLHQSSVKEVAKIAMVVLVDGEKHPANPLYFMCYELWFHYECLVGKQLCTIKNN